LPKEKAELLGTRLKEKNLLAAGTSVCWYRSRKQEFTSYFSEDGILQYCCNIPGLMQKFGIEYKLNEWQLFIDFQRKL
jgi:ligand-binding sensor domain-containing protein